MNHLLLRRTLVAASRSGNMPQRRPIFQWAAAHPDETMLALSATVAVAAYRIWKLEMTTREQAQSLKSLEEAMKTMDKSSKDRESELRSANEDLQSRYSKMRDDKQRMEASIIERGKAGEEVLGQLLDECKMQNIIKDYKLQYEVAPGKRPDALVDMDDIFIVIDSKAPNPPTEFDDVSRKEYANKLKSHARQLSDRQYTATLERSPTMVVMMLPGEGYLQAAYEKGKDIFELHKFARERNVLVLGPNGLRTLLQIVKIWLEEQAAKDRLEDMHVQENIVTTLQPLWVDLLPLVKKMGSLLEKTVTTWNSKVDHIIAFDEALRSEETLNLPKARKSQLPKKVTMPKSLDDR